MSPDGRDLFAPRLGLTLPLCGLHFVFFFLIQSDPKRVRDLFAFEPHLAFVKPWSFVTYQFLNSGMLGLFFGTMILYILGMALEAEWGTGEFAVFWLVSTLGGSGAALLTGTTLGSGGMITGYSMLFTYAFLFPEMVFYIFFAIPVKVKWLAWFAAAGLGWTLFKSILEGYPGAGLVSVCGSAAGFLFYWVRHHGAWKARKKVVQAAVAVKSAGAIREDALLERRNRDLFPRVEELRLKARQGADLPPRTRDFAAELATLVVPGVKICKPIDFKGDKDGICLKCDGFPECSLRYVAGQPEEIVVRKREP